MNLAAFVRAGLDDAGVGFDAKPFLPHLTIARRAALDHGTVSYTHLVSLNSPILTVHMSNI